MTTTIHPKTAGATLGASAGLILVAVLQATGVHVDQTIAGAISAFLSVLVAYLTPAPRTAANALRTLETLSQPPNPLPAGSPPEPNGEDGP